MPESCKHKMSQSDKNEVIKLYSEGNTIGFIARKYQVTCEYASRTLHVWGIDTKRKTTRGLRDDMIRRSKVRCPLCGETNPDIMSFHHKKPVDKVANVPQMPYSKSSVEDIKTEIAKCVCLCFNCHHRIHQKDMEDVMELIADS